MKKHLKLILFFIFSFAIVITLFLCYINSFNSFSTISLVTSNKSNLNLNLNNNLNLANFYSSNFSSNDNIIAYLSIPKISLFNVPIEYGTNKNVLSKAIGLFENSNIEGGNICLAAHNRSNTVSYFKDLWKLNIGDEILLKTKDKFTTYFIYKIF